MGMEEQLFFSASFIQESDTVNQQNKTIHMAYAMAKGKQYQVLIYMLKHDPTNICMRLSLQYA